MSPSLSSWKLVRAQPPPQFVSKVSWMLRLFVSLPVNEKVIVEVALVLLLFL